MISLKWDILRNNDARFSLGFLGRYLQDFSGRLQNPVWQREIQIELGEGQKAVRDLLRREFSSLVRIQFDHCVLRN